MSNTLSAYSWPLIAAQPSDVRELSESERDALIISAIQIDGQWHIRSRYAEDIWELDGFTSNTAANRKLLNFATVPPSFRVAMKEIFYRYLRRGRRGAGRPKGGVVVNYFANARPFLLHLEALRIAHLGKVTPILCTAYVVACKEHRQSKRSVGKPLSQRALDARFKAVEAIYELSQYTHDPIPQHPWPDSSALALAGLIGRDRHGKTPLIPDDVFCTLFKRAYQQVESGQHLLDLREAVDAVTAQWKRHPSRTIYYRKNRCLHAQGWAGGMRSLNKALIDLRTACYVVLASTSGCRNHELANVHSGGHHRTEDDEGSVFHWMRSKSDKTDCGIHDWMIPEAAVRALRIMDRWAAPYQVMIAAEIAQRRQTNPHDPQITEAHKHRNAIFLGQNSKKDNQVRTLSNISWNKHLATFAKECGLNWHLASHQFRRKFANYAAHSCFGDLRYLKEHFAHWSLDMTLQYAIDESWGQKLDLELYDDIQMELDEIKLSVIDTWVGDTSLAGGLGSAIKQWQREPQNLLIFKSRDAMVKSVSESISIRSNGHAWCTADDGGCIGNTHERTRCGNDCSNAVIGPHHMPIYQRLYDDLKGLRHCPDIGEGGRQRVERDLNRCRHVLTQLGIAPEILIA